MAVMLAVGSSQLLSAAEGDDDVEELEEIIVTAQFREQNLQDTPLAITAVSGEQLADQGLTNVKDLGLVIPNASIRQQGSFSGPTPQVGMRGVSTTDFIFTSDPGVGVYIDDVYQGSLTGSAIDLLDLERIEVLRGPQGTLFGKNSLGGAIRLISKEPAGDDSGMLELTYGSSNRLDMKGSYDFALAENLFMRITGVAKRIDGYGDVLDFACQMRVNGTPQLAGTFPTLMPSDRQLDDNCKIAERGGGRMAAGRVMLRWVPTNALELSLSGDYTSSDTQPSVDAKLTRHSASNVFNNLYSQNVINALYGVEFTVDDRFMTGDPFKTYGYPVDPVDGKAFPVNWTSEVRGLTGKLKYDFTDVLSLDLIAAYRDYQIDWMGDGDQMPIDLNHTYVLQGHDQTSIEARLSGATLADNRLAWTVGLYRYEDSSHLGGYVTLPAFALLLPNFNQNDSFTTESNSAFLHGDMQFTDRFSMTAGMRYTDEEKVYRFDHSPYLLVPTPLNYGSSHFDWRVSANFRFSETVMSYVQAATGFRSDGAQPRPFTQGQQKEVVPAEELISYEIGLKTDLFDRRMRLNVAAFFDDYDPRVVLSPGTQCNLPTNPDPGPVYRGLVAGTCPPGTEVGDAPAPNGPTGSPWFAYASAPGSNRGLEAEITANPVASLNVNATLAWFDFKSDAPATINGQPNNVYVHPTFKVQAEWSGSLGVEYRFQTGAGSLTPRLDWFFQGSRSNGIAYLPQLPGSDNQVPAYGLVNARITYVSDSGDWMIAASAENLLDKFYWYQLAPARSNAVGNAITDNRTGTPARGREVALTFRRNFN
jgi:iron complex outermembrane receptor protein